MSNKTLNFIKHLPLLALALLFIPTVSLADCYLNHPDRPSEISTPASGVVSLPADLENNRTVYESSHFFGLSLALTCSIYTPFGLMLSPELGPAPTSGYTFPIKDSGIGIQIFIGEYTDPEKAIRVYGEKIVMSRLDFWGTKGSVFTFRFVKTGKIKHGTAIGPLTIGTVKFGSQPTLTIKMTGTLVISASSCKTPDISVNMGEYVASEVTGSRGQTTPVNFDIALNECPDGINRVTYSLQGNTPVIDGETGLVSLDGASGAKGIGLRIMGGDGTPLALDKAHDFSAYDVRGGNFKIPLSAAYIQLDNQTLGFGTANTSITFTISYL